MTSPNDFLTAAAVLAAFPCYPVPPSGQTPAIEELRSVRAGQGLLVGADGVMLILRRPWLALDAHIAPTLDGHVPYGKVGDPMAELRCGLIPRELLRHILQHFEAALPNEAAAFVIWDEHTAQFTIAYPEIEAATPSRLVYRTPTLAQGSHIVCDIHSHGNGAAFFSATDDADDAHSTKIAIVFGRLDHPAGPTAAARLCAGGMFLPMPRSPFTGDDHDA
ncbi:PRTRC system protein A [Novosphingobium resinovorum]|uniref:PRTRC system protein A n=1 Tax=Novosphingobium resinovorum TaxID=158500 RepID=A0A1D8A2G0_9SPHN|nr:PRTRC system protein A [Novosphingobium resinovorum]AOR76298.1 PRTRC system protein A [Novosphingobium resinovorum]